MQLRRFRKQYEQLSQFERGRIIGMMEAGWSARQVACQLEMSFTRRQGSGRHLQTSRREDRHIERNACVQPTASSVAIQAQVAPSLGAPVSSRTIRRRLVEGHLGSWRPLRVLPLTPIHRRLRLEWCHARGIWTAVEWSQVVFSDESRFNLSSDDNRVRVWRSRGERLNPAFALQRHTARISGAMVWGIIVYNTRSPLVLIRGNMTAQWYVNDILQPHVLPLMQRLPRAIFQQDNAQPHKTVSTLLLPSLACPIHRFVSNRAYLGSFRKASLASHEFERTRAVLLKLSILASPFSITIFIAPPLYINIVLNAIIVHFDAKATIFIINRTNS
ncbi:transposable element Tcb2 transposase [Trichonephila clavipes]|nr:transposable element Tcb2 transposase [Trichonephila clavipes]